MSNLHSEHSAGSKCTLTSLVSSLYLDAVGIRCVPIFAGQWHVLIARKPGFACLTILAARNGRHALRCKALPR